MAAHRTAKHRWPASGADPPFAGHGLIDHAEDRTVAIQQSDQNTEGRASGDEGAGAIDRVENPAKRGVGLLQPEFLAKNTVVGETLPQNGTHRHFRGAVGDGDRGPVGFRVRGDAGPEPRTNGRASDIGGGLSRRDQPVQVWDQGSGTGLAERLRRYTIRSARCCGLFRP